MSERVAFRIRDPVPVVFRIGAAEKAVFVAGNPLIVTSGMYPEYEGPYQVTPLAEAQVLETRNRSLTDRITVGPIPQNYGLITYNGNKITVS